MADIQPELESKVINEQNTEKLGSSISKHTINLGISIDIGKRLQDCTVEDLEKIKQLLDTITNRSVKLTFQKEEIVAPVIPKAGLNSGAMLMKEDFDQPLSDDFWGI